MSLLNPQNSNLSVMRTTLVPQLILNAQYNLNHGIKLLKLFELNKVFLENNTLPKSEPLRLSILWSGLNIENHWKFKPQQCDFFQLKGIIEDLLELSGLSGLDYSDIVSGYLICGESQSILCNGIRIAEYGRLKPSIAAQYGIDTIELKQAVWIADIDLERLITLAGSHEYTYQPAPKYPSVERDISFLIRDGIAYSNIQERIRKANQASILHVCLIDEYAGKQVPEGFRSLTFRIVFNHPEKTLTDDEVESVFVSIVNDLKSQWDIQLR
jgi:phenylalanyl-tRNA synthetase beta chain